MNGTAGMKDGLQIRSGNFVEKIKALPGIETWILYRPAPSIVTIPTELPGSRGQLVKMVTGTQVWRKSTDVGHARSNITHR